jgi:broad specificity phosphatase PhoE
MQITITMRWPGVVPAAMVAALLWPAAVQAQKLVIVVRHAERADSGAGVPVPSMAGGADPLLSAIGEARAAKLSTMLADAGITAIFATEYHRTEDTAKPIASKLGVKVEQVKANDTAALLAKLKGDHARDVVLVIGHSNTMPDIIKGFGGPSVTIGDNEYDNIFIIVPATGAMTRIRF